MWLLDHLDEYLERWVAFCAADSVCMNALVKSDLHTVLRIGVGIFGSELTVLVGFDVLKERWNDFVGLVEGIDGESDKSIAAELSRRLALVRKELLTGK